MLTQTIASNPNHKTYPPYGIYSNTRNPRRSEAKRWTKWESNPRPLVYPAIGVVRNEHYTPKPFAHGLDKVLYFLISIWVDYARQGKDRRIGKVQARNQAKGSPPRSVEIILMKRLPHQQLLTTTTDFIHSFSGLRRTPDKKPLSLGSHRSSAMLRALVGSRCSTDDSSIELTF